MSVTAPETSEQTMAMRVVAALRDDIVTMALRPGDIISESDIAGRYGVSRQPVREAFIRLAQQGLLLIRPKRATVVKKISPDGVRQSRFIRESIEVEIIRRLAAQPSADAAEILTGLIDDQDKASSSGDSRRFHLLDELFHRTLARLAGVEYAWQLIDDHKMQLDRVRYLTLGASSSQRAIAEHRAIAEAIKKADPAAAEAAMRDHLARAEVLLTQTISDFPDYFE
ncbi:MAG: GntR family transcriptional regulator [Devosia sp.]|uniref:GntR family transcriptional regulator n=1 Tax=unclassified Devosia TaxID=196773 RepID=UPI0019F8D7BC|nr:MULTISPECIES: GntR family transcriptional regulator [unclassified Devosia]MBF0680321.1 GntR family transcriptional regulator [Devosia sp.]WEJ32973.1 GntR family transcriptional regulator [Devosia sp. SD17-2]